MCDLMQVLIQAGGTGAELGFLNRGGCKVKRSRMHCVRKIFA